VDELDVLLKMKKLIETPEAESYSPEIRSAVVGLVGLQLLFEWRYWTFLLPFMILNFIALSLVERMGLPFIGMIGVTLLVVLPSALLWPFASWWLQRWTLAHRRDKLLHAVGSQHSGAQTSNKESTAEQDGTSNGG
jgi:hypothetical protein